MPEPQNPPHIGPDRLHRIEKTADIATFM